MPPPPSSCLPLLLGASLLLGCGNKEATSTPAANDVSSTEETYIADEDGADGAGNPGAIACVNADTCPTHVPLCIDGVCVSDTCTPGETSCSDGTLMTCAVGGLEWHPTTCLTGLCEDGACQDCSPGCDAEQVCWLGDCLTCKPGSTRCVDTMVEACNADGTWESSTDCSAEGVVCFEPGYCAAPCTGAPEFAGSNSGCDFWAVDMDHYANYEDAQSAPFGVIVSNLAAESTTVTVSMQSTAEADVETVETAHLAPNSVHSFNLPPRQADGSALAWTAYRIQSTGPVVAYQFNPIADLDILSSDASLLLPVESFGKEYRVVSRGELLGAGPLLMLGDNCLDVCSSFPGGICDVYKGIQHCLVPYRGNFTVVGVLPDTTVTVVPTALTLAGPGVPAMQAGETYTFALQPYQVLNVKTNWTGADLTGTLITSNRPVGVFSGHESTNTGEVCCTDHLEEQLPAVHNWGKEVLATKTFARGVESDYYRVVATHADTSIEFVPAVHAPMTLGAGQWVEVKTVEDFRVVADKPIMVAQTLASSEGTLTTPAWTPCQAEDECHTEYYCSPFEGLSYCVPKPCQSNQECPAGHACQCLSDWGCNCRPVGDPALIVLVPTEQFRNRYVFVTPNHYVDDYINVIAPSDATVTLDGVEVSAGDFTAIPDATYHVARIKVTDGIHELSSTAPVGVTVYGYDSDISYGYAAGLSLEAL